MATIPPKNYLAKTDEFLAHWPQVNTSLGSALALTGNYLVAGLTSDRTALAAQITAVEAAINNNQGAVANRDTQRATIREKMRQFNQAVRGLFFGSNFVGMLPRIPNMTSAPGLWMKAMADMNNVWTQINATTPVPIGAPIPLILTGGYTLALFTTDQASLNTAFTAIETTGNVVTTAIQQRDALWNPIYARLRQYRLAVQGRFATGAALLNSLPALTPPAGTTPAAVTINAVWNPGISKAVITYSASTNAQLQEYELRASFGGTKYNADTASVLDSNPAGTLTPFETASGLVAPGSKVFYKVFVITTTGNEKGSNTASVTRP